MHEHSHTQLLDTDDHTHKSDSMSLHFQVVFYADLSYFSFTLINTKTDKPQLVIDLTSDLTENIVLNS